MTGKQGGVLFLLFSVGPARYALPVDRIVEIVPLVDVQPIPQAPDPVLGLMNYRGRPVPVIDLRLQFLREPSERNLSTRIVVVWWDHPQGPLVGLMAEKATETDKFPESEFLDQSIQLPQALQLGPVRMSEHGMVQMVLVERLLTDEMKTLFAGVTHEVR